MIVCNPIIMILKAILNWFRIRRNYIANAVDKIPPEIKDALVAWYSPKKQKLTNYDVIVRDKIANSPRGKELLEKQLNNIRAKKDIIVEKTNKELELFKKFQIAAQANPKLTYVEFCKTINNE